MKKIEDEDDDNDDDDESLTTTKTLMTPMMTRTQGPDYDVVSNDFC